MNPVTPPHGYIIRSASMAGELSNFPVSVQSPKSMSQRPLPNRALSLPRAGEIPRRIGVAIFLPLAMSVEQGCKAVMDLDIRIHGVLTFAAPHPQALDVWCDMPGIIGTGISPPLEHFTTAETGHRLHVGNTPIMVGIATGIRHRVGFNVSPKF